MGMKWFWGIVILAIASLLLSWLFAMPKAASMEGDIKSSLASAGYDFANVEMDGSIARLTGDAPSEAFSRDAEGIAENTKCEKCKGEKKWHKVDNQMTYKNLPTQSPYEFDASKDANGNVVLSGYVQSDADKAAVLAKAKETFFGTVTDRTIKIALGAPDNNWNAVIMKNMEELQMLNSGRFIMEDKTNFISGEAASAEVRASVNAAGQSMPAGYEFAANISVPDAAAVNVGTVQSKSICQTLFDDLNQGKTVEFANNRAQIRGDDSFDLLNSLASAANQCQAFRIAIAGYTDNVGNERYNQKLSEDRANTVVAYLNSNDVELSRMTATGFGEDNPRASNETPEGRAMNRRIEFTLTQAE